jgi:hypothetical protein
MKETAKEENKRLRRYSLVSKGIGMSWPSIFYNGQMTM